MSSAKPPFVLVFDVDGTLIDSRGHLNHSVVELLCLGIIAREYGIVSAILILTNNVFQQTNANGTKGHVMEWLTTTLVRRIIDYIVNHRYIEYRYRITQSKIFELASQIISDIYQKYRMDKNLNNNPNRNFKNIINTLNSHSMKRLSYKIFDNIFDKKARENSKINREHKSMKAVSVMLNEARKNMNNVGQRVFFINDDNKHKIENEIEKNQYIHIDPEFSLSQNLKTRMGLIQIEKKNITNSNIPNLEKNKLIKNLEDTNKQLQSNIHEYLKQVSNNINSTQRIKELKEYLKKK
jgi:hypothetical protein